MKKLNILLTICLFIVTGMLITLLMSKDSEAGSKHKFECEKVKSFAGNIYRCENNEAICYDGSNGMACKFKR